DARCAPWPCATGWLPARGRAPDRGHAGRFPREDRSTRCRRCGARAARVTLRRAHGPSREGRSRTRSSPDLRPATAWRGRADRAAFAPPRRAFAPAPPCRRARPRWRATLRIWRLRTRPHLVLAHCVAVDIRLAWE